MTTLPLPVQFLAAWIVTWMARHQERTIDYLKEENRDDPLEAFALDRKDKALGEGVQIGAPWRKPNDLHASVLEGGAKLGRVERIPLGERHLRHVISEFVEHYHRERNHQGLENLLIDGAPRPANTNDRVLCKERLGGLLNDYHRKAA